MMEIVEYRPVAACMELKMHLIDIDGDGHCAICGSNEQ